MDIGQYLATAAVIASVVMLAVGGLKSQILTMRSGWTVLVAAILAYSIAASHAFATAGLTRPQAIEQALVVGTVAWWGSLGVAFVTRFAPKQP